MVGAAVAMTPHWSALQTSPFLLLVFTARLPTTGCSLTTVNTTAELRHALANPPPNGRVALFLPEGNVYLLGGAQLRIHHINVSMASEGTGAILDAGGHSRHVDVALGGTLLLERIHLRHGGAELVGGAALVRFGGQLTLVDGDIADCEAVERGGAVAVEDYNGELQKVRVASSGARKVLSVAISADGRRIASGDLTGNVTVWDADTLVKLNSAHSTDFVNSVAISTDGRRIVSGDAAGNVTIWDANTLNKLNSASSGAINVYSVAISPDGLRIVSGDAAGNVTVWDANTLAKLHTSSSGAGRVLSVAISTDGRKIVSGDNEGNVTVWDVDTLHILHTNITYAGRVLSVAISTDGRKIVSGDDRGILTMWDTAIS